MKQQYQHYAPSEALKPYVDSYWVLEDEIPHYQKAIDRIIPTVKYGLIFTYGSTTQTKSAFQNQYQSLAAGILASHNHYPILFKSEGKRGFFGVKLKPHTVNCLLKLPASVVVNQTIDLFELFGMAGKSLTGQILEAQSTEERIRIIESFLIFRLIANSKCNSDTVQYAISIIRAYAGNVSINKVAAVCELSERQMQRLFLLHVGMSPKFFARTVRINHIFDILKMDVIRNWQDIVHSCGYFDQSHFIKEFKEFADVTPEVFFRSTSIITDIFQGNDQEYEHALCMQA